MRSQIQTNNVNSTELWVELDEQQSSELSGGLGDITIGDIIIDKDDDVFDSSEFDFKNILKNFSILSGIF